MKKNRLLETLRRDLGPDIPMRRYSLADMISESYKIVFDCKDGSNLKKLAESHLQDVRENPKDVERLSRQLCIIKELGKMVESNELKDEDLVDKKAYDTVEPKKDRVIQSECNESVSNDGGSRVYDLVQYCWEKGIEGDRALNLICKQLDKEGISYDRGAVESKMLDYFDEIASDDEEMEYYDDFDESKKMRESRAPRRSRRRRPIKESCASKKSAIKEADDPEPTEEELKVLVDYLEDMRKEKKNAPKTDMSEADEPEMEAPKRRGIKCHMADSKKEDLDEADIADRRVRQLGVDVFCPEDKMSEVQYAVEDAIRRVGPECSVSGIQWGDTSWSAEEYGIKESKKVKGKRLKESKYYRGLQNFKKQSESKAFFKTFKKMHESLKEGKALTRQESIDLYKAANSALTQMSIELEHNPKFLKTFNESSTLLSADVNSLRESLARGKAPSKKTMRSLAKFSEALLRESASDKEELEKMLAYEWGYVEAGSVEAESSIEMWREGSQGEKDMVIDQYAEQFPSLDRATIIQCIDNIVSEYEAKGKMNEADKEDEEFDDIDAPEDFVGDDEGDIDSEEADAFDQEYADARVALHKELQSKHADNEDPGVQEKLAQDAEEVINLPGTTEEQIAELNGGEEAPEEPEGDDDIEDEPGEEEADDSEITDDELAELKKHLKEMRSAKKGI